MNGAGGASGGLPGTTYPPTPGAPPPPGGDCGGGPDINQGCSTPGPDGCRTNTCGDGDPNADCCGTRCCRFEAAGGFGGVVVNCWCGECPGIKGQKCGKDALGNDIVCPQGQICNGENCQEPDWCVKFCDTYYKTNGEHSPACHQDNVCNECQECTGEIDNEYGIKREYCKNLSNKPCHCSSPDGCNVCKNDGSTESAPCRKCCSVGLTCCGTTYQTTSCVDENSTLSACQVAREEVNKICAQKCGTFTQPPSDPDPGTIGCNGVCYSTSLCYPSGNPEDGPPPPPAGTRIATNYGYIKNDETGEICWLLELCDMRNVADDCKTCDCNCHNDCAHCQLCGADGKCYPDPSCELDDNGEPCPKCPDDCCNVQPGDVGCVYNAWRKELNCCTANTFGIMDQYSYYDKEGDFIGGFLSHGPPYLIDGKFYPGDLCGGPFTGQGGVTKSLVASTKVKENAFSQCFDCP